MELVLLLVVGGAFFLFRFNTRSGAEIMRAHVYLLALMHDKTQAEANAYVAGDMTKTPPQVAGLAKSHIQASYGGKSLAMVADAYRNGMGCKLPAWQRALIAAKYDGGAAGGYRRETENSTAHAASRRPHEAPTGSTPQTPTELAPGDHSQGTVSADFDSYYRAYLSELKRLAGKGPNEAHPAELMEEMNDLMGDNITEQAFREGMTPQELAAVIHRSLLPHFPDLQKGS